jgi:ubiquinone/menaquinone biosynthesis C-methylase UbiE
MSAARRARRSLAFSATYGSDYFQDDVPNSFYYASRSDLRRIVSELQMGVGQLVVDLGCGGGAPDVWVAHETGARVVGVDLSSFGLRQARERARSWDLQALVQYVVTDLRVPGLADASCDGAMSLDALDTIPRAEDRGVALREAARVLKPAARIVITTWEHDKPSRVVRPAREPVADYRPLIEQAGLQIESYEESRDWKDRDRAFHEHIVAARSELRIELGDESAETMMHIARESLAEIHERRRVFAVARRTLMTSQAARMPVITAPGGPPTSAPQSPGAGCRSPGWLGATRTSSQHVTGSEAQTYGF